MVATGRYSDGMTNTATPAHAEKAKQFFALAQELINLCDTNNRRVIACAIQAMVELADDLDRAQYYPVDQASIERYNAEREQAWAEWYAEQG